MNLRSAFSTNSEITPSYFPLYAYSLLLFHTRLFRSLIGWRIAVIHQIVFSWNEPALGSCQSVHDVCAQVVSLVAVIRSVNPTQTSKKTPATAPHFLHQIESPSGGLDVEFHPHLLHPFPVPSPSQPQTLDELLAHAKHYAEFSMRTMGRVPPTLFLIGADGLLLFIPSELPDDKAKDDFATTSRLICIAHAATVTVMTLESWMKSATPGEGLDETERLSEAIDRQEVVVLLGESRDGQKQKFLPIIRSGNGKFFGFGESDASKMDQMKGRFAQILPPKVPEPGFREVAHAMLKVKGVAKARPAKPPRQSRPRF